MFRIIRSDIGGNIQVFLTRHTRGEHFALVIDDVGRVLGIHERGVRVGDGRGFRCGEDADEEFLEHFVSRVGVIVGELVGHDGGHVFAAVRGYEVGSAGVVGKELGDIVDSVVEGH